MRSFAPRILEYESAVCGSTAPAATAAADFPRNSRRLMGTKLLIVTPAKEFTRPENVRNPLACFQTIGHQRHRPQPPASPVKTPAPNRRPKAAPRASAGTH